MKEIHKTIIIKICISIFTYRNVYTNEFTNINLHFTNLNIQNIKKNIHKIW